MRMAKLRPFLALASWLALTSGTDVVYVTDLSIFTVVAPCVQTAISDVIFYLTDSLCQSDAPALQSCVCSQDNNFPSISKTISEGVSDACGSTASDNQATAATVLLAYCNQNSNYALPSPTVTVSDYITDITEFQNLAPCAATALSELVQSMTNTRCPSSADLLATCACEKDGNTDYLSAQIRTDIGFWCSSHSEDITSAQNMLNAYCGLVNGTSSFPQPTNPPGDMTYYITDVAAYNSLAPCAQRQVSEDIQEQTAALCPAGPEALASCVCLNTDMTNYISSIFSSDIKFFCDSTATDALSSAFDVYNLYCSAASGVTKLGDITTSESAPAYTGSGGTPINTGQTTKGTNTGSGSSGNSSGSSSGSGSGSGSGSSSNVGIIAGAVVGAVLGTVLIAVVAFLLYRRSKKAQQASSSTYTAVPPAVPPTGPGKPELDNTSGALRPTPSPSPSAFKDGTPSVSPVPNQPSPYGQPPSQSPFRPQQTAELHNQTAYPPGTYNRPTELQVPQRYNHQAPSQVHNQTAYAQPSELQTPGGYNYHQAYEVPGHGQNSPPVQEMPGVSWQSGPVPQTYEMDGRRYDYGAPQ
ncbi:hypothetical protein F5Y16DRAFT_226612 [Xylariaceae sp. FL0255]|nr:hypothetical protein F5Y16DRAFT_226612 [Xylariaceae sp. FL0255]